MLQESGVTYQVRLVNGLRVRVNVFVVYNHPREVETDEGEIEYEWPSISRRACPKDHCEVSFYFLRCVRIRDPYEGSIESLHLFGQITLRRECRSR